MEFSETLIGKQLQNKGEKKDDQTIETKISSKGSDKDKLLTFDDDALKIDGSTVGIPEGKEVDKTLKVTEGSNTFDTPQKDPGDKRITPKSKNFRRFWNKEINFQDISGRQRQRCHS